MTYRQLCTELHLKPDVKHKAQQLKKIQQLCELKIDDKDYEIVRMYTQTELLEHSPNARKNRAFIEPLLYSYLDMQNRNYIEVRMSELLQRLFVVNKNYYPIKHNVKVAQEIIAPDNAMLYSFIYENEQILKQLVYDVLRDMRSKSLIEIVYLPTICNRVKLDDGNYSYPMKILRDNDYHLFLEAQKRALSELGYDNLDEVPWYRFGKVKQIIAKELHCTFVCYTYKIYINREIKDYILDDFYDTRMAFNRYIADKVRNDVKHYKEIDMDEKDLYIDYCISVECDVDMTKKIEEKKNEGSIS